MTPRLSGWLIGLAAGAALVAQAPKGATKPQIYIQYALPGDTKIRKAGPVVIDPPLSLVIDAAGIPHLHYEPPPAAPSCAAIIPGQNVITGGSFGGFSPFPLSEGWHQDISGLPVDPRSAAWVDNLRATVDRRFRAVYPISTTDIWGVPWEGRPFSVVSAGQDRVAVSYTSPEAYPTDSDPGPFPIPVDAVVGGTHGPGATIDLNVSGDKHIIVIDRSSCLLYELWNVTGSGNAIVAGTGTVFDMLGGDHQRPYFMTGGGSVSGLPLMPGLIRYEEMEAGEITHPISFTGVTWNGSQSFTGMASHHQYLGPWDANTLPMGGKIRLRAGFDISSYSRDSQVILRALKKYGMVLVDGGLAIDIEATSDRRWTHAATAELLTRLFLTASGDWEAVQEGPIYCDVNKACGLQPPPGAPPVINSFTASGATPVTLSWTVSNAGSRIRFITPDVGPVVGDSVVVSPAVTTTYTLMIENAYGRATQTVTVTITP